MSSVDHAATGWPSARWQASTRERQRLRRVHLAERHLAARSTRCATTRSNARSRSPSARRPRRRARGRAAPPPRAAARAAPRPWRAGRRRRGRPPRAQRRNARPWNSAAAVGHVARVEDAPRRDGAKSASRSATCHQAVSKKRFGSSAAAGSIQPRSLIPAWARMSRAPGWRRGEVRRPPPPAAGSRARRGRAPARARSAHERDDLLDHRVRQAEGVRARVELDPARAGVEAAARLVQRVGRVRVDPGERLEPAAGRRARRRGRGRWPGRSRRARASGTSAPARARRGRARRGSPPGRPRSRPGRCGPMCVCASNHSAPAGSAARAAS